MGSSHTGWNHITRGIDHLTRRRTQSAGIVKGREDKRDHQREDGTGGRKAATIAVRNTQTPARLPSGADGPLKRAKVILKREGEVEV